MAEMTMRLQIDPNTGKIGPTRRRVSSKSSLHGAETGSDK